MSKFRQDSEIKISKSYLCVKRVLDFTLAVMGIVVLAVPMLLVAGSIYIDDPGTVLFSQKRVGRKGQLFDLYKFRSMKMSTPKYLATAEVDNPDKYITKVGRVIRKYSIDELPQLFNVLKGDMSLVGPRPLIASEVDIHELRYKYGVYDIRPGITGLAQINGRDTVLPLDKVKWDLTYANNLSFGMDIRILLATVFKVFRGVDVVEGYKSKKFSNRDTIK